MADIPLNSVQALNEGIAHHRAGRLAEAEAVYRKLLDGEPENSNVLHLLGVIAAQRKEFDRAVALIKRAIAIDGTTCEFYRNLGNAFQENGNRGSAAEAYRNALKLRPSDVEVQTGLAEALRQEEEQRRPPIPNPAFEQGNQLMGQRRFDEAMAAYRRAIEVDSKAVGAWCNLGVALKQSRRYDESIAALKNALRGQPDFHSAMYNLGATYSDAGRIDEAIEAFESAAAFQPSHAESHFQLGMLLIRAGKHETAMRHIQRALALNPRHAEASHAMGFCLGQLGKHDDAIAMYRQALSINPNYSEAYLNLGIAYFSKREFEQAAAAFEHGTRIDPQSADLFFNLACVQAEQGVSNSDSQGDAVASYREVLRLRPDHYKASANLGMLLQALGRFEEAKAVFEHALSMNSEAAELHWNLGLLLLTTRNFSQGWREIEWRWKWKDIPVPGRNLPQPRWDGSDLNGKTILLHAEQGFGDTIQFIRYVPMVVERGGRVILSCPHALSDLLRLAYPEIELAREGDALPSFDVHCPLMSLPLLFDTQVNTIPAPIPYLKVDEALAAKWAARIKSRNAKLRVGIVWAGNSNHPNDRSRSMKFNQILPLAQVDGVQFYNLYLGLTQADRDMWNGHLELIDLTEHLQNFAETAAMISCLDLVIAVDTAVAHVAGAIAKPVWLMIAHLPDWRWMLDRDDTPWYPTMRLFRQKSPGDWADVVKRIAEALGQMVQQTP